MFLLKVFYVNGREEEKDCFWTCLDNYLLFSQAVDLQTLLF